MPADQQVETGMDEGEESLQSIHIEAPKEPEVDPIHYKDVESLIFRGFLVLPADINGVQFLFKSMNHHELEYLQWVTGGASSERYYNTFLAYGVFMIAGQNILPERERWIPEFEKTFEGFSVQARTKLIRNLSEVNRRAANAITLTEAYQMERISRFRWAQYKGLEMMSSSSTGIEGTSKVGMNYAQLVWRALNHYEDVKESSERDWENAKFIGSCFAGKEIRKIYSQDKDRRQKELEERIQRKDQIIRQVLLGEDLSKDQTKGQVKMVVAKTVEELASQLERDLRGEKDWHDEIVAREEAAMRQSIEERRNQLRELQESKANEPAIKTRTDRTGLTLGQVQERLLRNRQYEAQEAASKVIHPEMSDERLHNFIHRHYGPSSEESVKDRDTTDTPPLVVPPKTRPPGTPFRR